MSATGSGPITRLLTAVGVGDDDARDELWRVVYDELRAVARGQMAREAPGRTLQPTTLVHETYMRLLGDGPVAFANRRHFFAAAAIAMRRIRVDDARRRNRLKRGGPGAGDERGGTNAARPPMPRRARVFDDGGSFPGEFVAAEDIGADPADLIALDEALENLERQDGRKAEIVNLRYFAGLTVDETAATLGLSPRTVDSEWRFARAWLHRELSGD